MNIFILLPFQGNLNESRLKIVKEAFQKADKSGNGVFEANDMKRVYKTTEHPKYKNGEWDENQVIQLEDPDYNIVVVCFFLKLCTE